MKRLPAVLLLATFAAAAFATTYVRVEKDGTKTYSDRPLPGGQPVDVQPAQTYSSPPPQPSAAVGVPNEQQLLRGMGDVFRYESCQVSPRADQTFTNPESVSLGVDLRPTLRAGDVLQLTLDGSPVGGPNAMSFLLKPVARGSHTVAASVKDRYGRSACEASATFHVFQPSLNSPTRRPPPRG